MLFLTKMMVVWPLIIDQRLVHLSPHMFPCNRSHSLNSRGVHFLVKNPKVLAFGIIENTRSWLFSTKMGVVCDHWSWTRGSYTSPHICFLAIDHILGFWWRAFLGQKSIGVSFWYYWKLSFMLFSTKMGLVWPLIIDQRLVHLTPHMFPCHRSHSSISGGDHF
jgi:hypothetical protein